jgi:hypothetical protein
MIVYLAQFIGCKRGAIGIHYRITCTVRAANPREAELKLYDDYDHIQGLKLRPRDSEP